MESCASCLYFYGRVLSPYKIDLEYYDIEGNKYIESFEDFEATVLSYELDHLDGILHIDIAEEVINIPKEERKVLRQSQGYKIYSKTGVFKKLKVKQKILK